MTRTIQRFITQFKLLNIFTKWPETGLLKNLNQAILVKCITSKYIETGRISTPPTDYIINTGHVLVEMPNLGVK